MPAGSEMKMKIMSSESIIMDGWLRAPRHMKSFKQHFQLFTQQTFENHTSSITQRNMKKFDTKVQTKTNFHFFSYVVVVVEYQLPVCTNVKNNRRKKNTIIYQDVYVEWGDLEGKKIKENKRL